MPTKRITRIHSPDSVDDKKLVKNEAVSYLVTEEGRETETFYRILNFFIVFKPKVVHFRLHF